MQLRNLLLNCEMHLKEYGWAIGSEREVEILGDYMHIEHRHHCAEQLKRNCNFLCFIYIKQSKLF